MKAQLKDLLGRLRRARAGRPDTEPARPQVQAVPPTQTEIIVVTSLDLIRDDEFSKYF